jgi:tetratricopeptide (TPR) repeat protein
VHQLVTHTMADAQELFDKAQKAYASGSYAEAYEIWAANTSAVDPAHRASLLCNMGKALTMLGRAGESLERYTEALALEPGLPSALRGRTAALLKLEDFAAASAAAAEAAAAHPADGAVAADVALCHLKAGRAQEAVAAFEAAIELGDRSEGTRKLYGNALSQRATALTNEGELSAAEALLDAAIAIEATETRLFNRAFISHTAAVKADEAAASGKYTKKALGDLRAVLRLNAAHPTAHRLLGVLLVRVQDWDAARVALTAAVKIDPRSTQDLYNLGFVNLKLGAPGEAKGCFERALAIDPAMAEAAAGLREASGKAEVRAVLSGGSGGGAAAAAPPPPPPPPPPPAAPAPAAPAAPAPAAPAPSSGLDPAKYFLDPATTGLDGFNGAVHALPMLQREPFPAGVERGHREAYLSAAEFQKVMGASKPEFYAQPKWKRDAKKKDNKLF